MNLPNAPIEQSIAINRQGRNVKAAIGSSGSTPVTHNAMKTTALMAYQVNGLKMCFRKFIYQGELLRYRYNIAGPACS